MYYVLLYDYGPNAAHRRVPFREAHLALLRRLHGQGQVMMAGAWASPLDGAAIVFSTPDRSVIHEFVRADPYVANGVVARWRIREWSVVIGPDRQGGGVASQG